MEGDESISFPDGPRSELEQTIGDLIDRAQRVLDSQGRLRSLLAASTAVVGELHLEEVLRRIVEAAVSLVDARYGALGVVAPDGHLERFIHVGVSPDDVRAIGHLPEGHGLLGAVVDLGRAIRVPDLGADPRSAGFPAHHPRMESFLGVPIRIGDEVFGNLYLTNRASGPFSAEDEELVAALASTAGIAINNARLYDESERRRRWSEALADVNSALLSGSGDVLAVIADRAGTAIDAELVCVVVPAETPGRLRVHLARGAGSERVQGRAFDAAGTLAGRAAAEGSIASVETEHSALFDWQPATGPSIALPLLTSGELLGVLTISRRVGGARFSPADLGMAAEFAAQAGVAIELARAREDRERLEIVGERARIARDLHDHVIQRLYAAGLDLHAIAGELPGRADALLRQVEAIDGAIADIRTAVFTLGQSRRATTRHAVLDIAAEFSSSLGFVPRVSFAGPVDLLVEGSLAEDVAAVVREALANVARHADASGVAIEIRADERAVVIEVDDDGRGLPADVSRRGGTSNLADRARSRGGRLRLLPGPNGGTRVEWTAPTNAAPAGHRGVR